MKKKSEIIDKLIEERTEANRLLHLNINAKQAIDRKIALLQYNNTQERILALEWVLRNKNE